MCFVSDPENERNVLSVKVGLIADRVTGTKLLSGLVVTLCNAYPIAMS